MLCSRGFLCLLRTVLLTHRPENWPALLCAHARLELWIVTNRSALHALQQEVPEVHSNRLGLAC